MARAIAIVCIILLIGIGCQYLVYGCATNHQINWAAFTTANWIFEVLWIVFLFSLGVYFAEQD